MAQKRAPARRPAPKTRARKPRPAPPAAPAFAQALARLPALPAPSLSDEQLARLEEAFGWPMPQEARRVLVALCGFELEGGAAQVLAGDDLARMNALPGVKDVDPVSWTTRRLGLFAVAADVAGNRLCLDLVDRSGHAPVYLVSPTLGLTASTTPIFPRGTELVHAFALYTAGEEARDAEKEVERLTAELKELRSRRPQVMGGARNDALARLEAAFGGMKSSTGAAAGSPSAEDESRLAGALEAAKERHKSLWMPFIEQFARWPTYWSLLWNGPRALAAGPGAMESPLSIDWRNAYPLGQAVALGQMERLHTELRDRQPQGRAALALAEARVIAGDEDGARAALSSWDATSLGPLPPLADRILKTRVVTQATQPGEVDWGEALGLSRVKAERFLSAVGAQFAQDLRKHGTSNILGATKAAVRLASDGSKVVEAGLGHVPLEVRKALFEGKPVQLSGQFLRALNRELTRRLHEPSKRVEKTLTRLRLVVEQHINAHATLNVPHVGTFRVKNEPAPTGAPRYYLLMDVAPNLVAAAQGHEVHVVSPAFHPGLSDSPGDLG
ncbi:MAG: SMI1/KNR4 family protein [Myxococcota bacterium]